MSANTTVVPEAPAKAVPEYLLNIVPSQFLLGDHTMIEAHARFTAPTTPRGGMVTSGKGENAKKVYNPGAFAKQPGFAVHWSESEAHPYGWNPRGGQMEIKPNGHTPIPQNMLNYFDANNGLVAMKVVSYNIYGSYGHYAAPAMYKKVWTPDPDENLRPDGTTGFTIPLHKLTPESVGKKPMFFFVIRITGGKNVASLFIDRITVSRGAEHFHVRATNFFEEHNVPEEQWLKFDTMSFNGTIRKAKGIPELKDLMGSIEAAMTNYKANLPKEDIG